VDLESGQILRQIRQWREQGRGVALATVVQTWGSSPRPAGCHLAVDSEGRFAGSVSGGCVEAAVIHEAQSVIRDGRARRLQFGVSDERAWEVGLACGGQIDVFIERIE
jgi:xanthine/CO dehydrogenase XdhC/CoxF family maturation factor